jgi:hypothetical protein
MVNYISFNLIIRSNEFEFIAEDVTILTFLEIVL